MARYWLCVGLLVTLGCAVPPQGPAVDLGAERQALLDADAAWFESFDDLDAFVGVFAADAVFMPDGAPAVRGGDIRTTLEQFRSLPGFHLEWRATDARVAEAADLGYTIGAYEITTEQDGTPVVEVGKYVTVWSKQADGSWKVNVDCFNADAPPGGA